MNENRQGNITNQNIPNSQNQGNDNLSNAQKNTQMRNDSNVQARNANLKPRTKSSPKSSNSDTTSSSSSISGSSSSSGKNIKDGNHFQNKQQIPGKQIPGSNLKQRVAKKTLNKFGGPAGKIIANTPALKKMGSSSLVNAVPGLGAVHRLRNVLNSGKQFKNFISPSSKPDVNGEIKQEESNLKNNDEEHLDTKNDDRREVLGGTVDLIVKIKKYKWFLIGGVSLFSIVFALCILAGLLTNATVGAGVFAHEATTEELEKTAEDRSKREDTDEFNDVENDVNDSIDNETGYIDDNIDTNIKFVKNKLNVDADDIADYYGVAIACGGNKNKKCTDGTEYKYYLKMYDIYFLYKKQYNVKLDLPYIMAALNYSHEQMPKVFQSNLNEYNREDIKSDDYSGNLSWEFDYKNYPGYTYLNANDNRFDMQILAKNMVTKKITYECKGGNAIGNNSTGNSSNVITTNKESGNGWNSVTKIKYANGVERTYRNYKQYQGDYRNDSFSGGNIHGTGCGPSNMAIVLSGYGYNYNPGDVVKQMHKLGFNSTYYDKIITTLKSFGVKAELKSWTSNSEKEIRANFDAGRPVIVGVSNHYVTYVGLDKDDKLIISDPGTGDGKNALYGATISELKSRYGQGNHQYILIKSDGNASTQNDTSSSNSSIKTSSGSGSGKVIKKANFNNKGGYSGLYESRTTGKIFKEYKQNSRWAISKLPKVAWKQECGKISALTIGSGYSTKATYTHLYTSILGQGSKNATVHGIIDTYTKTKVDFQSMISIKSLKNFLSKGYVASIHIKGYPNTSTHYLSILDIDKKKKKIYISDPWGGSSYNGWKDISIVQKLRADEICLVPNDNKVVNSLDNVDGSSSSSNSNSKSNIVENKIFYIGDSWIDGLNSYKDAKSSNAYFYYKIGKNADWVLKNYSEAKQDAYNGKSLKATIPKDTSAIVISFGLNGTSLFSKTQSLASNLLKDYPGKNIFVLQTPHVRKEYSSYNTSGDKFNHAIDSYNDKMKSFCSGKDNLFFINPTKNIVSNNGKGYLKKTYASGTYHLNAKGDKIWYKDIIKEISASDTSNISSNDVSNEVDDSSSSSNSDESTAIDVETSKYDEQLKCDGGTLDKDSINAKYELDLKKFQEFLHEFVEHKYFMAGSEVEEIKEDTNVNKKDGNYVKGLKFLDSSFGKIVYFNQGDYAKYKYGNYGTIQSHGCGTTSLAIVISSFTGQKHDPVEITNYVCKIGGCTSSGTTRAAIAKAARDYGLNVQAEVNDRQKVLDALGTGKALVIAIMHYGHFTTSGHYIVLTGTTSDGKVTVADPGHRNNCHAWDFNIVAAEANTFWIITSNPGGAG